MNKYITDYLGPNHISFIFLVVNNYIFFIAILIVKEVLKRTANKNCQ